MFHKTKVTALATMVTTLFAASATAKQTADITAQEYLANRIKMEAAQPAKDQIQELYDELDFQRAVQAYIWATPFVNISQIFHSLENDFGADLTHQMIWEQSVTPELKVYTPNNTTIYSFGEIDLLKHGPVVLDAPAGVLGGIDNHWMYPMVDIGPFGPDKMQGGKFLIVPPGYEGDIPTGYFVVESDTNQAFYLVRGIVKNGDKQAAIDTVRKTRIYPLSQAANPPEMHFTNASGKQGNMIFPSGYEYFERLAENLQFETARPEDKAMLGFLAPLGIEVGKPFNPTERQKEILTRAAKVGNAMSRTIAYNSRDPKRVVYGEESQWEKIFLTKSPSFYADNYLDVDARVTYSHQAAFTANGMVLKLVGKGSQYLATYKDDEGQWLDGSKHYKLHLDADIPAVNFWSVMLYDSETRSMILNGEDNDVGKDGSSDLIKNADGSIDIYFGPTAPKGKENNWLKTNPGNGWFTYFRAYGPTKAYFDKTWQMNNIVEIK